VRTAGLPAPLQGTAGSWKQRNIMEATHLPFRAGFKWIRTARAGPPRNCGFVGFSYIRKSEQSVKLVFRLERQALFLYNTGLSIQIWMYSHPCRRQEH